MAFLQIKNNDLVSLFISPPPARLGLPRGNQQQIQEEAAGGGCLGLEEEAAPIRWGQAVWGQRGLLISTAPRVIRVYKTLLRYLEKGGAPGTS